MKRKIILLPIIILTIFGYAFFTNPSEEEPEKKAENSIIDLKGFAWVDSVFKSLTPEQRIAQLIMIRAHSDKTKAYHDAVGRIIKDYNVGGICFFQGGPIRQINLTNEYQQLAKTPLMVAIDGEWGVAMRLDSVEDFPRQMTLGAITDDKLIYEMGKEVATQCIRLGININFAPVVDVNNNPMNPVINSRSFGEDQKNVANKGIAYMQGMQSKNVLACAKHFPGHGDTDSDSHLTLPIINKPKEIIDSVHIYPFKKLIEKGLGSIMVAHLYVPAYDDTKNTATTLSKKIITDLLVDELNFKGLIITDALGMQGVAKFNKPGEIEVKAIVAGNDILLLPTSVPTAISEVKKAIGLGVISQKTIDNKCKKVLAYKYWLGLSNLKKLETENIYTDLNSTKTRLTINSLYESSITLVKNNNDIIPLKNLDTLKIASVSIGYEGKMEFQTMLSNYSDIAHFQLPQQSNFAQIKSLIDKLKPYNLVIVGIHNTHSYPSSNFGIRQSSIDFVKMLQKDKKIILDIFASPYALSRFTDTKNIEAILISYQDNKFAEQASAQLIFGGIAAKGQLPVTGSNIFKLGKGLETSQNRLHFAEPENVSINSIDLKAIDSIANHGITEKAYPGCQVLIAKNGNIIFNKSYGYHTYDSLSPVLNSDLYDLASLTKIAATTLAIMKLSDEKKIDIDKRLGDYLPCLDGTNKEKIIIRDLMAHQAKLYPWIPFYRLTINENNKLDSLLYCETVSPEYSVMVDDKMFIKCTYKDSILQKIIESDLLPNNKYKYSDIGFYLLKEIIEKQSGTSLDKYVYENFYKPLGLYKTCFNPLKTHSLNEIVPTELDTYFRNRIIHGYVHDPGAAMMGGVEGHAGLFSNAADFAVIMQMLLQGGEYGGKRYIKESTVKEFTKRQFPLNKNRRGIGFDKPLPNNEKGVPACIEVSDNSFGHSGFTGTYAWADPDCNLVYIFLSNRTYPSAEVNTLLKLNIRTEIHKVVYKAIEKGK
ncbi:MAG: serine hydrolase [Saprospiraceae bacterium]|nr:serine hydrolase [Saprospiraceae bacterium]